MTALGYARNQEPFLELAERVPLTALESLVQNESEVEKSLVRLQALIDGNGRAITVTKAGMRIFPL